MTKVSKVEPNERVIKKKEVWDVSLDFTYHVNGRGEEDQGIGCAQTNKKSGWFSNMNNT